MKSLLAFVFAFSASAAIAGQLSIDVTPIRGGATYLDFVEKNGKITANGNGPFSGSNNHTYVEERADGSLQGFVFGTPFNLSCTATACADNGPSQLSITISKSGSITKYDGMMAYHPVHATVSDTEITVTSDASFSATIGKNSVFVGHGGFSRVRFGAFDMKLAATGGFNINDPRLFVLTVLTTFSAIK